MATTKLTETNINEILDLYREGILLEEISRRTGHSVTVIKYWVNKNNLTRLPIKTSMPTVENRWTKEEVLILKESYKTTQDLVAIANRLGRSVKAVTCKARKLKLSTDFQIQKTQWSIEDSEVLKTSWATVTIRELSSELGYSTTKIRQKAKELGLPNIQNRGKTTSIERMVIKCFENNSIQFNFQYKFKTSNSFIISDFYLPSLNLVLEVNGDYWHANPKLYKDKLTSQQIKSVRRDSLKYQFYKDNKIKHLVLWESDLNNIGALPLLQTVIDEYKCIELLETP